MYVNEPPLVLEMLILFAVKFTVVVADLLDAIFDTVPTVSSKINTDRPSKLVVPDWTDIIARPRRRIPIDTFEVLPTVVVPRDE